MILTLLRYLPTPSLLLVPLAFRNTTSLITTTHYKTIQPHTLLIHLQPLNLCTIQIYMTSQTNIILLLMMARSTSTQSRYLLLPTVSPFLITLVTVLSARTPYPYSIHVSSARFGALLTNPHPPWPACLHPVMNLLHHTSVTKVIPHFKTKPLACCLPCPLYQHISPLIPHIAILKYHLKKFIKN